MKITKRTWIIIVLILCLLVALAGNVVARKMQDYLSELDSRISEKKIELDQMKADIGENEKYVAMWKDISEFKNESPVDRQNKFNAYIQTELTESTILYRTLYPPTTVRLEASPNFQLLHFKLSFSTGLSELLDFILRLDQSKQLLRLESLAIKARTKSPSFSNFSSDNGLAWNDLAVDMTVSIPAAKPSSETSKEEVPE